MSDPSGGAPHEPRELRGPVVALGIVLGLVATFVWMFAVFILALSGENGSGGGTSIPDGLIVSLFALPLPVSILMLCFRRTRQAGAGFVMGLAIGSLVLAGFCSGIVVLPSLGA